MLTRFIFSFIILNTASAEFNYKLFQVTATTFEQKRALINLSKSTSNEFVETSKVYSLTDLVLVPFEFVNATEDYFITRGMTYEFLDPRDVLPATTFHSKHEKFSYNDFYESQIVHKSIIKMVNCSASKPDSPVRAEIFSFGSTYLKKSMLAFRLGRKDVDKEKSPVILIDATIHGNEWIGPPAAHKIIEQLLFNATGHELMKKFDIIVAPIVNRDGYDESLNSFHPYIHGRKNRKPTKDGCLLRRNEGTDINRNFDWFWNSTELTENPCSENFRGEYPNSEPETIALSKLMETSKLIFYYTIHSYGNLILYPYGNTDEKVHNFENMRKVALAGKDAMESTFEIEKPYKVGSSLEILRRTSGASKDYAAGKLKIPISLIHEVGGRRPDSQPRVEDIKTYVDIVWTGFTAMANKVAELEL
ncbi:hypothetical protein ACFFRR_001391 [Megaselia abdita]